MKNIMSRFQVGSYTLFACVIVTILSGCPIPTPPRDTDPPISVTFVVELDGGRMSLINNATGVNPAIGQLSIVFNEDIQLVEGTSTPITLRIVPDPTSGTSEHVQEQQFNVNEVSISGTTLNLLGVQLLAMNSRYTLNIPQGVISDAAGNTVQTMLNFTTAERIPGPARSSTAIQTAIENGNTVVRAEFDKPIALAAEGSDIRILSGTESNAGTISNTISRTAHSNRLVLTVAGVLLDGDYTISIAEGAIQDSATPPNGNERAITEAFTINATAPAVNTGGIAVNRGAGTVSIRFNENIQLGAGDITIVWRYGQQTFTVTDGGEVTVGTDTLTLIAVNLVDSLTYNIQIPAGIVSDTTIPSLENAQDNSRSFTTGDTESPSVSGINFLAINIDRNVGTTTLTVSFTEPVSIAQESDIRILSGTESSAGTISNTISRTAHSNRLVLTVAGVLADGDYTLSIAEGAIQDSATPPNGNERAITEAFTINTTAPAVNTGGVTVDRGAGTVSIRFSENIQAGAGDITITGGAGQPQTFTVTDGGEVTVGTDTLTLRGVRFVDSLTYNIQIPAGIVSDTTTPSLENAQDNSRSFTTGDTIPPSVSGSDFLAINIDRNAGTTTVTVRFTEPVSIAHESGIRIVSGTESSAGAISNTISRTADSNRLVLTVAGVLSDGDYTLSIAEGTIQDRATPPNGNNAIREAFEIDNTEPALTPASAATPTVVVESSQTVITLAFTEDITRSSGTVTLTRETDSSTVPIDSTEVHEASDSLVLTIAPDLADGDYTINIAANAVIDTAGNANEAIPNIAFTVDSTALALIMTFERTIMHTEKGAYTLSLPFDDPIARIMSQSGVRIASRPAGDTTSSVGRLIIDTDNPSQINIALQGLVETNGSGYTIEVAAGTVEDAAGNGNQIITLTLRIDATAPTGSIFPPIDSTLTEIPTEFTITFNENVTLGESPPSISLSRASTVTVGSPRIENNTDLVFAVSGLGEGNYTLTIPEGIVVDSFGNENEEILAALSIDTVHPALEPASVSDPSVVVESSQTVIRLVFTEDITRSSGSVTLTRKTDSSTVAIDSTEVDATDKNTLVLTISSKLPNAEYIIDIAENAVSDAAGNANETATNLQFMLNRTTLPSIDNTLIGTENDDEFQGRAGNYSINGAGGSDTVVYESGELYTLSYTLSGEKEAGYIVVSASYGSDLLRNIEIITLSDMNDTVNGLVTGVMVLGGEGTDSITLSDNGNDIFTIGTSYVNYKGFEIVDALGNGPPQGNTKGDTLIFGDGDDSLTIGIPPTVDGVQYINFENFDGGGHTEGDNLILPATGGYYDFSNSPYTGFEIIHGSPGADFVRGSTAEETFVLARGEYTLRSNNIGSYAILYYNAVPDTLEGIERILLSHQNDTVRGLISGITVDLGEGYDTIQYPPNFTLAYTRTYVTHGTTYANYRNYEAVVNNNPNAGVDLGTENSTFNVPPNLDNNFTFQGIDYIGFERFRGGGASDTLNLGEGTQIYIVTDDSSVGGLGINAGIAIEGGINTNIDLFYEDFEIVDAGTGVDILHLNEGTHTYTIAGNYEGVSYRNFETIRSGGEGTFTLELGAGDQTYTVEGDLNSGWINEDIHYLGFDIINGGRGTDTLIIEEIDSRIIGRRGFVDTISEGIDDSNRHIAFRVHGRNINIDSNIYQDFEIVRATGTNDIIDFTGSNGNNYSIGAPSVINGVRYEGFENAIGGAPININSITLPDTGEVYNFSDPNIRYKGFLIIIGSNANDRITGTIEDETFYLGRGRSVVDGGGMRRNGDTVVLPHVYHASYTLTEGSDVDYLVGISDSNGVLSSSSPRNALSNIHTIRFSDLDDRIFGSAVDGVAVDLAEGRDSIYLSPITTPSNDTFVMSEFREYTNYEEVIANPAGNNTFALGRGNDIFTVLDNVESFIFNEVMFTSFDLISGWIGTDTLSLGNGDSTHMFGTLANRSDGVLDEYISFEILHGGNGANDRILLGNGDETYTIGNTTHGAITYTGFEIINAGDNGATGDTLYLEPEPREGEGWQNQTYPVSGAYAGVRYTNFETIDARGGNDSLALGNNDNTHTIGTYEDRADGVLDEFTNFEIIDAGEGNDTLVLPSGGYRHNIFRDFISVYGPVASTSYIGFETVEGSSEADVITGRVYAETFNAGAGNDYIAASNGSPSESVPATTVNGGAGNDTLQNGMTINGDAGNDTLTATRSDQTLNGGADNDAFILVGSAFRTTVNGGAGVNAIIIGTGSSSILDSAFVNLTDSTQSLNAYYSSTPTTITIPAGIYMHNTNTPNLIASTSNIDIFVLGGPSSVFIGNEEANTVSNFPGFEQGIHIRTGGGNDRFIPDISYAYPGAATWYDFHNNGDADVIDYSLHFPGCSLSDLSFTRFTHPLTSDLSDHLDIATPGFDSPNFYYTITTVRLHNAFEKGNIFAMYADGAEVKAAFTSGALQSSINDYFAFDSTGTCRSEEAEFNVSDDYIYEF